MGVPGFNTWFKESGCPKGFKQLRQQRFNHVMIDLASILHTVMRKAKNVNELHKGLHRDLDRIIWSCQPQKSVLFAMDGPAPLAKLLTQRHRRTATGKKETRQGISTGLSPIGLTPGTLLMMEIENSLHYYITNRLSTQWPHLHIEVSSSSVPGEGEVKIIDRLKNPLAPSDPDDTFALVGGDSDLFLMTLLQPQKHNLWIVSEQRQNMHGRLSISGFSTKALDESWKSYFPDLKGPKTAEELSRQLRDLRADIAVVAILSQGNDYLPSLQGLTLHKLWKDYLDMKRSKQWKNRSLVKRNGEKVKLDLKMLLALFEISGKGATKIKGGQDGWTLRKPKADPGHFMRGLEWVIEMYCNGRCSDYRYSYEAQAPTFAELLQYFRKTDSIDRQAKGEVKSLTPSACALSLLPPTVGISHAVGPLQSLMSPGSPLFDLFQTCTACEEIDEELIEVRNQYIKVLGRYRQMKESGATLPSSFATSQSSSDSSDSELELEENERQAPVPSTSGSEEFAKVYNEKQKYYVKFRHMEDQKLKHFNQKHPYEPFPVERIEDAIKRIPQSDYSPEEYQFLNFREPTMYWKKWRNETCCCPSAGSNEHSKNCMYLAQKSRLPADKYEEVDISMIRNAAPHTEQTSSRKGKPWVVSPKCRCPNCWSENTFTQPAIILDKRRGMADAFGKRLTKARKKSAAVALTEHPEISQKAPNWSPRKAIPLPTQMAQVAMGSQSRAFAPYSTSSSAYLRHQAGVRTLSNVTYVASMQKGLSRLINRHTSKKSDQLCPQRGVHIRAQQSSMLLQPLNRNVLGRWQSGARLLRHIL